MITDVLRYTHEWQAYIRDVTDLFLKWNIMNYIQNIFLDTNNI